MPTASDLPRPTSLPPTGSTGKGQGELTVVGVVEEGVEHGCIVLRADNGSMYQLMGSTDALIRPGNRVSVRGRLNPGIVTTCMQGTPLQVVSIQPA